ncbi:MAG: hypothetical protein B7Z63_04710 [Ignavibacteriae bacterium 37-53-5]|nr:MAG: hypothetical protein B7Z63_04710 [Ignavibacteriae bacterium 37-53-5]
MILLLSLAAKAQTPTDDVYLKSPDGTSNKMQRIDLTGVLSQDLFAVQPMNETQDSLVDVTETRSALKAGAFSLLIPGAGQLYNRNYLKAAAFFAVEVAGWVVNAMWTQKANNQTVYFQNYADGTIAANYQNGNYSVWRYAQWIYNNYKGFEANGIQIGGGQTAPVADPTTVNTYAPQMIVPSNSAAPWTHVNWYALNQVEGALGGYFTHILPSHGDQQYYELIGKYPQFRQGWNDENPSILDFSLLEKDTPNSGYYMDQRGKANSLFAVASTAIGVVLVNHFASAIEAAIWAHSHNKAVQAHVSMSKLPTGFGYQTELQLAVNF